MSKGLTGKLYGAAVLPNTVRELVEAIYNQEDLPQAEALDMADYLDEQLSAPPNKEGAEKK